MAYLRLEKFCLSHILMLSKLGLCNHCSQFNRSVLYVLKVPFWVHCLVTDLEVLVRSQNRRSDASFCVATVRSLSVRSKQRSRSGRKYIGGDFSQRNWPGLCKLCRAGCQEEESGKVTATTALHGQSFYSQKSISPALETLHLNESAFPRLCRIISFT